MENKKIKVRFAPSPTGFFHLGSARTALFNFLWAKSQKGEFILRIEDTDKDRNSKEYLDDILNSLNFLAIKYDKIFYQSKREEFYKKNITKLIESNHAYFSEEKMGKRESVIRFRNPGGQIEFEDLVRGKISFDISELGDFVIAKSESEPLYHLAVVSDDIDMEITHIIRGEDHISNTSRFILLYKALTSKPLPNFCHIPLILNENKSKMSKRDNIASFKNFQQLGYLPEAMKNYLVLLGWNPKINQEIFKQEELINLFSLKSINKSGSIFDFEKLNFINKKHLTFLNNNDFLDLIKNFISKEQFKLLYNYPKLIEEIKKRISYFKEINIFFEKDLAFLKESDLNINVEKLIGPKSNLIESKKHLCHLFNILISLDDWNYESIKGAVFPYAEAEGKGSVLWPFRYALTGQDRSIEPFLAALLLGQKETLNRIKYD